MESPLGTEPAERREEGSGESRRPGPSRANVAPTPAETRALEDEELRSAAQTRLDPAARALSAFLREPAQAEAATGNGDPRTTVIDQGDRVTYAFGGAPAAGLFRHLEACRRAGVTLHFSERQGTPETPHSGVMLDYDLVLDAAGAALCREEGIPERHCHRLACAVAACLREDLDFSGGAPGRLGGEASLQVFFTVRPEPAPLPPGSERARAALGEAAAADPGRQLFKYGFHVLVPGVRVTRGFKKHLIRRLREDKGAAGVLRSLGALGDPAECLDGNSASVPVLFLGSCKRGGVVYALRGGYEVSFDPEEAGSGAGGYLAARRLAPAELEGHNLVEELSLCLAGGDAPGSRSPGAPPLVERRVREPRAEIAAAVGAIEARAQGRPFDDDELLGTEHALSTLAVHDPEARQLHQLLDLLGPAWSTERDKWLDVVFALANTSPAYRPLAEWFSQKYPKWSDGTSKRIGELDRIWADALARGGQTPRPLTVASIAQWAREANPARYREITERGYFTILARFVYDFAGVLEHYMVAKVIHAMLKHKFVVDIGDGTRGKLSYCFYEFVLPGQAHAPGEVWKWRKEAEPDEIHLYTSEKLIKVADMIATHIEEQRAAAETEEKAKYYTALGKSFAGSRRKLMNDGFKSGVVRQCGYLFRRRGFVDSLDKPPELMGVGNGVLALGPLCRLIDHYHEHPISRFTRTVYRPFDPEDPYVALLLRALADIYPELDVLIWVCFFLASSLSGKVKEGLTLLCDGSGSNGKTFVMRMVAKALGAYAKKLKIALLTSPSESGDKANSAMMALEDTRFGYFEETNKVEILNTQRLKEIVNPGEVTNRDLYGKQANFELIANLAAAVNYKFIIETTDHGTWRRIRRYRNKTRFTARPDPANPFEKKDDQKFVREYVSDPLCQSAMLGILVHFYQRLQREYGGELKRVPCPTIERETQEYRNSQDTINRYITEQVVVSPGCAEQYTLGELSTLYNEWYFENVDRRRHAASEVIQDLENSALSQFLTREPNRVTAVRGCRVLTRDSAELRPGETYFGARRDDELAAKEARGGVLGVPPERPDWWNLPSDWWDRRGGGIKGDAGGAGGGLPAPPAEKREAPEFAFAEHDGDLIPAPPEARFADEEAEALAAETEAFAAQVLEAAAAAPEDAGLSVPGLSVPGNPGRQLFVPEGVYDNELTA